MQIDCLCNNSTVQNFILNKFTVLLKKKSKIETKLSWMNLAEKKRKKERKNYRVKVSSPWAGTLLMCTIMLHWGLLVSNMLSVEQNIHDHYFSTATKLILNLEGWNHLGNLLSFHLLLFLWHFGTAELHFGVQQFLKCCSYC